MGPEIKTRPRDLPFKDILELIANEEAVTANCIHTPSPCQKKIKIKAHQIAPATT